MWPSRLLTACREARDTQLGATILTRRSRRSLRTPPTEDGTVEIAYFTYPEFEGQGCATGMAKKLVELAIGSAAIRRVIAHTLPEKNASTRVLEKVGMSLLGEVMDPEDGRVWRWQMQPGALPSEVVQ